MLELIGLFKMTHNYVHAALRSAVALVLLKMSFVSGTTQLRGADLGRARRAPAHPRRDGEDAGPHRRPLALPQNHQNHQNPVGYL